MERPDWADQARVPGATGQPDGFGQQGGFGRLVAPALPDQPQPPAGWRPIPVVARRSPVWPTGREWAASGIIVLAMALVGGLLALGWVHWAPRMAFQVVQGGGATAVVPESEEFIAADGWFAFLTLVAGLLAGGIAWRARSVRGPLVLIALAVGGLLGAIVTWRLGPLMAPGPSAAALRNVGAIVHPALRLRATAALAVEPIAAVAVYLLSVGFATPNDLGRDDEPFPAGFGRLPSSPGSG